MSESALPFQYGLLVLSFTLASLKTKNETVMAAYIDLLTILQGENLKPDSIDTELKISPSMFIDLKKTNRLSMKFSGFVNCFKMLGVLKDVVKTVHDDKTKLIG